MKRSCLLLCTTTFLGLPLSSAFAQDKENSIYTFYNPTRPGRSPVESMIVPRGRPGESRRVTAYTVLNYPGNANEPRPEIMVAFNGILQTDNVELRWGPNTGQHWVKVIVTLPARDLKYGVDGPDNPLEVTANLANGETITEVVNVSGVDFPPLDEARIVGNFLPTSKFNYTIGYHVPPHPIEFGKNFPLVGKYGFKAQLNGKLNVYPIAARYTSETTGGAALTVAGKEYGIEVGSKEETAWERGAWHVKGGDKTWQPGKWVKTDSKIYLGWYTSIPLWEKSLLTCLPEEGQKVVNAIPIVGPKLKMTLADFKFDLTANPSLYGEASLGLTKEDPAIKSLGLGGEMDLRLAFNAVVGIAGLGKFGVIAMAGGKLNLDIYYPVDNNLLGLQNLSAQLYVGTDFYFLCFESSWRFAMLEFHFPDLPQGPLPPANGLAHHGELPGFKLVPPPEAGEQVAFPLTPTLKSASYGDAASLATAKAKFHRLGTDRVITRQSLMPMGVGNIPGGSNPVIEAGAVLPLAVNTTSVAWPSIASAVHSDEMLALFGVDTRPPGAPPGGAQFTQVLWTYFKDGEWSLPVALPAGNGAAQIAPSVAALSDAKSEFICAWQQLQDPGFQGTGFSDWLNQTEVAVGVLQAEGGSSHTTPQWKTEIFGTPDRADISPKVAGQLGEKREDGVVMWISTSLTDTTNKTATGLPDDAEFRYAVYHKGKWTTPDYPDEKVRSKQLLKVPKGLLSWDFAADISTTFLVYSEDQGNDQSRIMAYMQRCRTDDVTLNEWSDPIAISDKAGKNLNPQIITDRSHNTAILWTENGSLVIQRFGAGLRPGAKTVLRPASDGAAPSGVKMTLLYNNPSGFFSDIAVSWTEQTPHGPSIVTSVFEYNTNSWSKPMAITPGEDVETLYAITSDRVGNLVPLYVHTDVAYGTVTVPNEKGQLTSVPNSPILDREKIMVGRFRPTRDLGFAPDALTSRDHDFIGGTTVQLTARVSSQGMLGYRPRSVSVSFYHGDPKNGGQLIGTRKMEKALPGGGTADVSIDWKLDEDIWDRDNSAETVYAVIEPPAGSTEWNVDNDTAILHLAEIVPSATVSSDRALQDGSAEVNVTIRNSGLPYMKSFPVHVYDSSGTRLIKSEVVPKVEGGSVNTINIELPAQSVRGDKGADFLVKVDHENTLKLHADRRVPDMKLHIPSATH